VADDLQALIGRVGDLQRALDKLSGTVGGMKLTVGIVAAIGITTIGMLGGIYLHISSVKSDVGDVKTGIAVMEAQQKNQTEALKSLHIIERKLDAVLAADRSVPQTPPTDDGKK